jgi:hypothetical protein
VRGAFPLRVIPSSPEATPLCISEVDPYDNSLLFIRLWNKSVAVEVAAFCLLPKREIRKEEKGPKPTDEHSTGTVTNLLTTTWSVHSSCTKITTVPTKPNAGATW